MVSRHRTTRLTKRVVLEYFHKVDWLFRSWWRGHIASFGQTHSAHLTSTVLPSFVAPNVRTNVVIPPSQAVVKYTSSAYPLDVERNLYFKMNYIINHGTTAETARLSFTMCTLVAQQHCRTFSRMIVRQPSIGQGSVSPCIPMPSFII